jgi:hypothetical protein
VVTLGIASLVLVSGWALAAVVGSPEVPPQPVPAPPSVHAPLPAADRAAASVADAGRIASVARPAPRPVPTPGEGGVLPNDQVSELPLLVVPGLLALAVLGLVAARRRACLPGASARPITRPRLAPCQEGAR